MKKIILPVDKDRDLIYGNHICYFLFQFNFEFYLIMYPQYMESYSHLDLKEDLLKQVSKIKESENVVKRGGRLKEIKKDIISGLVFNFSIDEVCHTYCDNAGLQYCFTNEHKYTDYIDFQFTYLNNYNKAVDDIDNDAILDFRYKKHLKDELKQLYFDNICDLVYTNDYEKLSLTQLILKFSIKKNVRNREEA